MRKLVLLLMLVLLVGCQGKVHAPTQSETIVEWADFIKINNRQYDALFNVAIADESFVGSEVGKVKYQVADNVDDPNYKTKEGDAAFYEKGTIIYSVDEMPDLVAVKNSSIVNKYQIYQTDDVEKKWDYGEVQKDNIVKVEVQEGFEQPKVISEWTEKKDIDLLFEILENGTEHTESDDDPSLEDPDIYNLVFYSDQPVASYYELIHEGEDWYWHPWEKEILPNKIEDFIEN